MKRLFAGVILTSLFSISTIGDAYILFVNRMTGVFDAPMNLTGTFPHSDQSCFSASLHLLEEGGSSTPLYPWTTFRNESEKNFPYIYPIIVNVPGKQPGDTVTVEVVTYHRGTHLNWVRGFPFNVVLGTLAEPGIPTDMTGFTILADLGPVCESSQSSQGYILFANRVDGIFDAPISFQDVWPAQARLRAELKIVGRLCN